MKHEDIRVTRTRQSIVNAYVSLAEQKNPDDITIQEIAKEAMINRATFYAHFKDKQDLDDYIFKQTMSIFTPLRNKKLYANKLIIRTLLEHNVAKVLADCQKNRGALLLILDTNQTYALINKMKPLLAANVTDVMHRLGINDDSDIPLDLALTYLLNVFIGILQWWLHTDNEISAKHLAHLFIEIFTEGPMKVLGIKATDEK